MTVFPALIDLTNLSAADGFIIQGDAAYDRAGYSVFSAGNVNGDGFDDMIVGAHCGDNGGSSAGKAYVIFGKATCLPIRAYRFITPEQSPGPLGGV